MAITQAICNSFKKQLLEADMNFKQPRQVQVSSLYLYCNIKPSTTAYPETALVVKLETLVSTLKVVDYLLTTEHQFQQA